MNRRSTWLLALALSLLAACDEDRSEPPEPDPGPPGAFRLVPAFEGLVLQRVVDVVAEPGPAASARIFVVEQDGRLLSFLPSDPVNSLRTVLDLRTRVVAGGERGLLGVALDPRWTTTRWLYTAFTTGSSSTPTSRVARWTMLTDPPVVDPSSEVEVLSFAQPFGNHNGGDLFFDGGGMLLVTVGDGGSAGDPLSAAQDRSNLLGSLLRLDVGSLPYSIPADNPFVGNAEGWREEIWAYGLRNPWRGSYDPVRREVWVGDVGQDAYEEIDRVAAGDNLGWDCREGTRRYTGVDGPSAACPTAGPFVEPVHEYSHAEGDVSVTGGLIYRGARYPELRGWYVFGDFASGRVWALGPDTSPATVLPIADADFNLSVIGIDPEGELLFGDYRTVGGLHRLEPVVEAP